MFLLLTIPSAIIIVIDNISDDSNPLNSNDVNCITATKKQLQC